MVASRHESRRVQIFLRLEQNTSERETSVRQLIHRVCRTIADWGVRDGYFDKAKGEIFYEELVWLCVNQYGAFNSPVWFNVGLYTQYGVGKQSARGLIGFYNRKTEKGERASTQYEYPQGSACFIQSVEDNMESIMHLAQSEAMLFKYLAPGQGTVTLVLSVPAAKNSVAADARAARFRSCVCTTRLPTSSNPEAKRVAQPR